MEKAQVWTKQLPCGNLAVPDILVFGRVCFLNVSRIYLYNISYMSPCWCQLAWEKHIDMITFLSDTSRSLITYSTALVSSKSHPFPVSLIKLFTHQKTWQVTCSNSLSFQKNTSVDINYHQLHVMPCHRHCHHCHSLHFRTSPWRKKTTTFLG